MYMNIRGRIRLVGLGMAVLAAPLGAQGWQYAVDAGVYQATVHWKDSHVISGCANCYTESIGGLTVGFSGVHAITSWLGVEAGLSYSGKGAHMLQNYTLHEHFAEFPLALRFTPSLPITGLFPYALVGIAPATRFACSISDVAVLPVPLGAGQPSSGSVCGNLRSTDRGELFGGGMLFDQGRVKYRAEVRRTIGLDINPDPNVMMKNDVTSIFMIAQFRLR
jgi:hypothetical protein